MSNKNSTSSKFEGSAMAKRQKNVRLVALIVIITMVGTTAVSMGLAGIAG
jgi:hypothetical protein